MKILTAFHLKIIAIVLMVGDHLVYFLGDYFPIYLRYAGRVVAPIFFFLAVESFFYTSSKERYLKRLFLATLAMFVGNKIVEFSAGSIFGFDRVFFIGLNIFFSIALGVLTIYLFDLARQRGFNGKSLLLVAGASLAGLLSTFSEYGLLGLSVMLLFYFFRGKPLLSYILYGALSLSLLLGSSWTYPLNDVSYGLSFQWMMIFALPFFMLYNGKRGASFKYFFYTFYPVHIWIIYFVSSLVNAKNFF